jgi:hypothetical protein
VGLVVVMVMMLIAVVVMTTRGWRLEAAGEQGTDSGLGIGLGGSDYTDAAPRHAEGEAFAAATGD